MCRLGIFSLPLSLSLSLSLVLFLFPSEMISRETNCTNAILLRALPRIIQGVNDTFIKLRRYRSRWIPATACTVFERWQRNERKSVLRSTRAWRHRTIIFLHPHIEPQIYLRNAYLSCKQARVCKHHADTHDAPDRLVADRFVDHPRIIWTNDGRPSLRNS